MAVEADSSESGAKKGIPKLFIIIGAAALVVVLGGAGLFFFLSKGTAEAEHGPAAGAHGEVLPGAHSFIFNLPPMIINLNKDADGEAVMKLTVALEVADESMMVQIQPRLAKVIDAFQVYLRELRKSDLEGSAGIYRLKEELLRRVNVSIYPAHVESILFKEILVQ